MNLKKYVAEFVGTFSLVFCGTGAIVINQEYGGTISHVGIAMTFGLVVMAMIYTFGHISGAHLNPAVTIAFSVAGKFNKGQVIPYILSQLAGAVTASLVLKILFPANDMLGSTVPVGSVWQSFILEFILTFILMLVIMNVAHGSKEQGIMAGLAIGATVMLEAMFAGPVSGASMNPARSLAPALVSGHTEFVWIYIVSTIPGAVAAIPVWSLLHKGENRV